MKRIYIFTFLIGLLAQTPFFDQTEKTWPITKKYGKVWAIDNPDFKVDSSKEHKAVFDIMNSPESHESVNETIETAARFLDRHVKNGIPVKNLKVALVEYNKALKDVITNKTYQKKYGTDNPNQELIKALMNAVGQSSLSRYFPLEDLIEGVQVSLSAMVPPIQLQDEDYRLIKF